VKQKLMALALRLNTQVGRCSRTGWGRTWALVLSLVLGLPAVARAANSLVGDATSAREKETAVAYDATNDTYMFTWHVGTNNACGSIGNA